jgi:hypothetical protein
MLLLQIAIVISEKEGLGSVAVRDTTVTARHRDALAPDRLFV